MRAAAIIFTTFAISGCAQQPARKVERVDPGPAPICRTPSECSVMWSNAIDQVQRITGMKISVATDSYLQTYTNFRSPQMMGQVYKMANPDGTATIRASFTCRHGCEGLESSAEKLFNTMIKPMDYDIPSLNPAARQQPSGQASPASAPPTPALTKAQWRQQQLDKLNAETGLGYDEYQRRYRQIMGQ